jgi:aerobic carbon-monoxide dehydrogenase medium subunit
MININKWNTHIIGKPFQYHQPETVEAATKLLGTLPNCKILVGGTDLVPKMKQRLLEPEHVVNLKKIPELVGIKETDAGVWIGAATKLRNIEESEIVQSKIPLQYLATKTIGSVQIRNMGTLGGNVCNASPAADGALGLVTQDATVHIAGSKGRRTVPITEFFTGPGATALGKDELVTGFTVPYMEKDTGYHFISIGRTALDISTISLAVTITKKDGKVAKVTVALGSVAPTPLRLPEVEAYLKGKTLTDDIITEAANMVSTGIKPITDIRASAEYRKEASKGMAMEALKMAWTKEAQQ